MPTVKTRPAMPGRVSEAPSSDMPAKTSVMFTSMARLAKLPNSGP